MDNKAEKLCDNFIDHLCRSAREMEGYRVISHNDKQELKVEFKEIIEHILKTCDDNYRYKE